MSEHPTICLLGKHPILRQRASAVSSRAGLHAVVARMRRVMSELNGIGIAAPQIGEPLRIFLIDKTLFSEEERPRIPSDVFVNPKLVKKSFKRIAGEEGCLSVPGVFGDVPRAARVTVEAEDLAGSKFRIVASELLARVLQHELDHLDGILFVDKAKRETLHQLLPDGTIKPWRLSSETFNPQH